MKINQGRDNAQNITTCWFVQKYTDIATVDLPADGKPFSFSCNFDPPESIAGKRCSMSNTAFGFMNNSATTSKIQGCALLCSGLTFPYNTESTTVTTTVYDNSTPTALRIGPSTEVGDARPSTLINIIRFPEFTNNIGPSLIVNVPPGPTVLTFTIDRPLANSAALTNNDRIYLCMQFEPME